jgi:hypothetical protein
MGITKSADRGYFFDPTEETVLCPRLVRASRRYR